MTALQALGRTVRQCRNNRFHWFYRGATRCPWCEIEQRSGRGDVRRHDSAAAGRIATISIDAGTAATIAGVTSCPPTARACATNCAGAAVTAEGRAAIRLGTSPSQRNRVGERRRTRRLVSISARHDTTTTSRTAGCHDTNTRASNQ
jgi:hypothetical protein